MRIIFSLILFLSLLPSHFTLSANLYAQQYCIPGRFDTTYYFTPEQIEIIDNVSYGNNTNWQGNPVNLKCIIAHPNFEFDTLTKRPFILLIHGGGFVAGNRYEMAPVLMDFALRGYVCASIDYRLGWDVTGDPFQCNGTGYLLAQAVYRAMQDSKAAFRYFAANADKYKLDTNYFFTAGISAGAVTSLLIANASQVDMNSYYPNFPSELGLLNNASNNLTNSFKIKCVISSSGGLNDTSFIKSSSAVPTLFFHGTADMNIPYGTGYVYTCANYLRTQGSSDIVKRFENLKKAFELNYVPGGGHENFYPLDYLSKRTMLFLKRYLCNDARQIVIENNTTVSDDSLGGPNAVLPSEYTLYQNYPNPFNPSTTIKYYLPSDSRVSIRVFDMSGREINLLVNSFHAQGFHSVNLNASSLSSGVYFYSMITEANGMKFSNSKKMVLIK